MILDEFPYAAEVEPALPSVQNAWDHLFKQTPIFLVLCGSHIGMMEKLYAYNAPLFGRISGQMRIGPMPFSATKDFLPDYSLDRRVAVYAMLGGMPAYLERFSDQMSLADNVRRHLFRPAGVFIQPSFCCTTNCSSRTISWPFWQPSPPATIRKTISSRPPAWSASHSTFNASRNCSSSGATSRRRCPKQNAPTPAAGAMT